MTIICKLDFFPTALVEGVLFDIYGYFELTTLLSASIGFIIFDIAIVECLKFIEDPILKFHKS
jgi:uncharacterized membrane protein